MIATVTDLIESIREVGLRKLNTKESRRISHPTMIGDMYEGLTRELLDAALLSAFNLHVGQGLIRYPDGTDSGQIDCVLATESGEPLPYACHHKIYDIRNVIAVVECTKNLTRKKLKADLKKLARVARAAAGPQFVRDDVLSAHHQIFNEAYQAVRNETPPRPAGVQSALEASTWRALSGDATLPIRVIWGYRGLDSHEKLRSAFVSCTQEMPLGKLVFELPNLVICGDSCIVKANGMPFVCAWETDADWDLFFSQEKLAVRSFVNILWHRLTKLSRRPFAEVSDGKVYVDSPLLSLYWAEDDELAPVPVAWAPQENAGLPPPDELVAPAPRVTLEEFVLVTMLIAQADRGGLDLSSVEVLGRFRQKCAAQLELGRFSTLPVGPRIQWESADELVAKLSASKLFNWSRHVVRLAHSRCLAWWNEAGMFAGENRDGRYWGRIAAERLDEEDDEVVENGDWIRESTRTRFLEFVDWQKGRVPNAPAISVLGVHTAASKVGAQHIGSEWHISLSSGLFLLVMDFFNRLLAHRDTFPNVGTPELEAIGEPSLRKIFSSYQQLVADQSGRPTTPTPRCPVRLAFARHVSSLSLRFILGREVARILRGHVDYEQAVLRGEARRPNHLERKALRFDADAYACSDLVRHSSGVVTHPDRDRLGLQEEYPSRERAAYNLAAAVHGALLLHRDMNCGATGFERTIRVRQGMVIGAIDRSFKGSRSEGRSDVFPNIARAIKHMEAGRTAIAGVTEEFSLREAFTDPLAPSIADAWFTVCPLLRPFALDPLSDCSSRS